MIRDIENGDLLTMTEKIGNVFEPGIIEKYPVIGEIKDLMEDNGALKAMMSGSGPTVFGIFDDREKMEAAAAVLRESAVSYTHLSDAAADQHIYVLSGKQSCQSTVAASVGTDYFA